MTRLAAHEPILFRSIPWPDVRPRQSICVRLSQSGTMSPVFAATKAPLIAAVGDFPLLE